MDFAVFAYFFEHPQGGNLAVHGDGYVALDSAVVNETVLESGVDLVEVVGLSGERSRLPHGRCLLPLLSFCIREGMNTVAMV